MADMKRTEQVSVTQLIEELKRFEKDYPDMNVTCCIPDGTICYAVSIDQDGDGQVCIGFEEEEEKRMLAEKAGKEKRERRIEYGALLIITILSLCGVAYNVWAVVSASGDSLWENILYGITYLFCFMIGLLALHYDRR